MDCNKNSLTLNTLHDTLSVILQHVFRNSNSYIIKTMHVCNWWIWRSLFAECYMDLFTDITLMDKKREFINVQYNIKSTIYYNIRWTHIECTQQYICFGYDTWRWLENTGKFNMLSRCWWQCSSSNRRCWFKDELLVIGFIKQCVATQEFRQ